MNPTIQNIFQQINELRTIIANQDKKLELKFPQQQLAGVIKWPGLVPFPFVKDLVLNPSDGDPTSFGAAVVESVATYQIDVDRPVYLKRITAGLMRTLTVDRGEQEDPLVFRHYAPLSSDNPEALCRRLFINTIEEPDELLTCYPISLDFMWQMFLDAEEKKITPDWVPSQLLNGDRKEYGYLLTCEYELKRGETLTLTAIPLYAIQQVNPAITVQYELHMQLHMYKMLYSSETIMNAQAQAMR